MEIIMTQEEKARAYDEALEGIEDYIKSLKNVNDGIWSARDIEYSLSEIFPELAESEDEKIKQWLIGYFQQYKEDGIEKYASGLKVDDILAWLEKQDEKNINHIGIKEKAHQIAWETSKNYDPLLSKESWCEMAALDMASWLENQGEKPQCKTALEAIKEEKVDNATKVEPKFKVGDWVVCEVTGSVYQIKNRIENLSNHKYGYDLTNGGYIGSDEVNHYHIWTIEDALDGDVLCTYECDEPKIVFILKGMPKKGYALSYHCYYNIMYPSFKTDKERGCIATDDIKPATKEQRDLLFQKMKEAIDEGKAEMDYCFTKMMNGEKAKPQSSTPMSYGKELEARMYEACDRFNAPNTDPNRYSAADLFYAGVEAGRDLNTPAWSKEDEIIKEALIDFFNKGAENEERTCGVYDKDILDWLKKHF